VPKLYEYLGLIVFFYANEHEPVHVHCRKENRESRAELILIEGKLIEIRLTGVRGKLPLNLAETETSAHWLNTFPQRSSKNGSIFSSCIKQ
jgi:hypothetical protein